MAATIGHGLELIATSGQDLVVGTIVKMTDPIVVQRIVSFDLECLTFFNPTNL